jgi:hypothetical protein
MSLEPTSEPQPLSAFHHYSAVQRENRILLSVASGELPSGSKPSESKRAGVSQIGTAGLQWGTLCGDSFHTTFSVMTRAHASEREPVCVECFKSKQSLKDHLETNVDTHLIKWKCLL